MEHIGQSLLVSKHNIYQNEDQPRQSFSPEVIETRRVQLESEGQLTPLLVFPADDQGKHELVDGECRWRAAMTSERFDMFRVEVYLGSREDVAGVLITQLLRNDDGAAPLTALEKAKSYQRVVDSIEDDEDAGSAFKQAADRLGIEYSEFTRALKVGEMAPHIADFVLAQGIDDKRAINGLIRVDRQAKKGEIDQVFDNIRVNDIKKNNGEDAQTTREIVANACKALKGEKATRGAKEKLKRKLTARKIEFDKRENMTVMKIETPREVITFELDAEMAEKFQQVEMTPVASISEKFEI